MKKFILKEFTVQSSGCSDIYSMLPIVTRVTLINARQINIEIQKFKDRMDSWYIDDNDIIKLSSEDNHILYVTDSDNMSESFCLRIDEIDDMTINTVSEKTNLSSEV